jgi:hypothetical protein
MSFTLTIQISRSIELWWVNIMNTTNHEWVGFEVLTIVAMKCTIF